MDYGKFVEGLIIIVLDTLILVEGVLGSTGQVDMKLFSLPSFKLAIGFIALVLAASFLEENRKQSLISVARAMRKA